jgi:hypothetical protein
MVEDGRAGLVAVLAGGLDLPLFLQDGSKIRWSSICLWYVIKIGPQIY